MALGIKPVSVAIQADQRRRRLATADLCARVDALRDEVEKLKTGRSWTVRFKAALGWLFRLFNRRCKWK